MGILCLSAAHVVWAQAGNASAGRTVKVDVISVVPFREAGESRFLSLVRFDLQELHGRELEKYFRATPESTGFPNVGFAVVASDSSATPLVGSVVWIAYVFHDRMIRPQHVWSGDVALYPDSDESFVALVESRGWHVGFSIYSFNRKAALARFPLELDPTQYANWPKASVPLSQLKKTLIGAEVSGIQRIRLIADPSGPLIYGEREHLSVAPVFFQFNRQSKTWAQKMLSDVSEPAKER
jgi:hypothetical protein